MEHLPSKRAVRGSNPLGRANEIKGLRVSPAQAEAQPRVSGQSAGNSGKRGNEGGQAAAETWRHGHGERFCLPRLQCYQYRPNLSPGHIA